MAPIELGAAASTGLRCMRDATSAVRSASAPEPVSTGRRPNSAAMRSPTSANSEAGQHPSRLRAPGWMLASLARHQVLADTAGREFGFVRARQRKFEVVAGRLRAELRHEIQQARRFGAGPGIGQQHGALTQDGIAAAVQLDRQRDARARQ